MQESEKRATFRKNLRMLLGATSRERMDKCRAAGLDKKGARYISKLLSTGIGHTRGNADLAKLCTYLKIPPSSLWDGKHPHVLGWQEAHKFEEQLGVMVLVSLGHQFRGQSLNDVDRFLKQLRQKICFWAGIGGGG